MACIMVRNSLSLIHLVIHCLKSLGINEQINEHRGARSKARKCSEQSKARERASKWAYGWASGPVFPSLFVLVLTHFAKAANHRHRLWASLNMHESLYIYTFLLVLACEHIPVEASGCKALAPDVGQFAYVVIVPESVHAHNYTYTFVYVYHASCPTKSKRLSITNTGFSWIYAHAHSHLHVCL